MNIIDIIIKKKSKENLTEEEINFVIKNYVASNIADYQMSSLLMAITLNGMTDDEIYYLTKAMIESGDIIDLSSIFDYLLSLCYTLIGEFYADKTIN